jgi:hypothetical protein
MADRNIHRFWDLANRQAVGGDDRLLRDLSVDGTVSADNTVVPGKQVNKLTHAALILVESCQ